MTQPVVQSIETLASIIELNEASGYGDGETTQSQTESHTSDIGHVMCEVQRGQSGCGDTDNPDQTKFYTGKFNIMHIMLYFN